MNQRIGIYGRTSPAKAVAVARAPDFTAFHLLGLIVLALVLLGAAGPLTT